MCVSLTISPQFFHLGFPCLIRLRNAYHIDTDTARDRYVSCRLLACNTEGVQDCYIFVIKLYAPSVGYVPRMNGII